MKKWTQRLCLLLSLLLLTGCTSSEEHKDIETAPDSSGAVLITEIGEGEMTEQALLEINELGESPDDAYRTFYEIFVYSFCDSDGDGIGDLKGVESKLDYLTELGVNGIWLMPIHPSTTYHKYNVSDYYAIDPQYGTMEDFESLITACQERDIHVILDLVVNHTGSEHPWFQEACKYVKNLPEGGKPDASLCKYVDYYTFTQETKGSGFRPVEGTDWYYEGVFDHRMPDLNLGNPEVRVEIEAIMKFWLEKGVSGFRLDAAKEFYTGQVSKNVEVLRWLQETAVAFDPDCYMVAEVWDTFSQITAYYESGITSIFNYAFGNNDGKIVKVLQGAGNPSVVSTYATALEKADNAYRAKNPTYMDAPFLSNHDVGRIAGFVSRDENKIKMAAAMNLFMSGNVFIYYGEEIGMPGSGNDPSKRAPMYWNEARDNGTTNPPPKCELPEEYPLGSLEEQRKQDGSVYNYYRKAIAIRKALPVISHGVPTVETSLNVGCVSAVRKTWEDQNAIILMNIDKNSVAADLSGYSDWDLAVSLCVGEESVMMDGTTLQLPPWGIAILTPAQSCSGGNGERKGTK